MSALDEGSLAFLGEIVSLGEIGGAGLVDHRSVRSSKWPRADFLVKDSLLVMT